MEFKRQLDLTHLKRSAFVLGPRMTGKTSLLRTLQCDLFVDLLDPEFELTFRQTPRLFWEQLAALKPESLIIVDEIQRVPALLDYVQKGIEEKKHLFILSGSSARKLKRGGANLLGGRAKDLKLHPLTAAEMKEIFQIGKACQYGTLPKVAQLYSVNDENEARSLLRSYLTTYIKEEIQAEALTRNLGAFQRFVPVAAQANAQIIEFANIARDCSVPASSVKQYYSILEDTLMGEFLWPWGSSERKKARPKFYFFDCGVVRTIQNRLTDPPTPVELGFLYETWFVQELKRIRDYSEKTHEFSFWREGKHEIDLLISSGHGPVLAIECKSGKDLIPEATVQAFRKRFHGIPLIVASYQDTLARKLDSGVEVLPWRETLERYQNL